MLMNNTQDVRRSMMGPGCWGRTCPIACQLFEGHEKEFRAKNILYWMEEGNEGKNHLVFPYLPLVQC